MKTEAMTQCSKVRRTWTSFWRSILQETKARECWWSGSLSIHSAVWTVANNSNDLAAEVRSSPALSILTHHSFTSGSSWLGRMLCSWQMWRLLHRHTVGLVRVPTGKDQSRNHSSSAGASLLLCPQCMCMCVSLSELWASVCKPGWVYRQVL